MIQTTSYDVDRVIDQYMTQCPDRPDSSDSSDLPGCAHTRYWEVEGTYVCQGCHQEFSPDISPEPEWRSFTDSSGQSLARCGMSINHLLPQSSYLTSISSLGRTSKGNRLLFYRLNQINAWNSAPYLERSRKKIFDKIKTMGHMWGLTSNILDYSCFLYAHFSNLQNQSEDSKSSRGNNRKGAIAACLYYACQKFKVSRQPEEIAMISGLDVSQVNHGIKLFYNTVKSSPYVNFTQELDSRTDKYRDLLERHCINLKLDHTKRQIITLIYRQVTKNNILSNNTPKSMIGAVIYYSCITMGLNYSKSDIAQHCKVSILTLSRAYQKLQAHNSLILDPLLKFLPPPKFKVK